MDKDFTKEEIENYIFNRNPLPKVSQYEKESYEKNEEEYKQKVENMKTKKKRKKKKIKMKIIKQKIIKKKKKDLNQKKIIILILMLQKMQSSIYRNKLFINRKTLEKLSYLIIIYILFSNI